MNVQVDSSCTAWWVRSPVGSAGSTDRARRAERWPTAAAMARSTPTETPPAAPVHHVDVAVRLPEPGCRSAEGRGPYVDKPRNPAFGRAWIRAGSMRFHGGTSTGWNRAPASSRSFPKPLDSSAVIASAHVAPELRLLLTARGVAVMGPSVLQHLGVHRFEPRPKGGSRQGRDDGKPRRNLVLPSQAREAVEGRHRRRGIVVPPPQRGDPTFVAPCIELVREIGPVHWLVNSIGGDDFAGGDGSESRD